MDQLRLLQVLPLKQLAGFEDQNPSSPRELSNWKINTCQLQSKETLLSLLVPIRLIKPLVLGHAVTAKSNVQF
jgi:hypothetical protein